MFLLVMLCYLLWFRHVALSCPDAPQFVCSYEHYCLAPASQPLPLAMPLDLESVSGKQDHLEVRQLQVLPSMTPLWYNFSSAAFLLLIPSPPVEPHPPDPLLSSSAPPLAHNRSYVQTHIHGLHQKQQDPQYLFPTTTSKQGGSLHLRPVLLPKLGWKPLSFFLPTGTVNTTLSSNKNKLTSQQSTKQPQSIHFSFNKRSASVTLPPHCLFSTMSQFSTGSPFPGARKPKATTARNSPRGTRQPTPQRAPAPTFVPASPPSRLVFQDPPPPAVFTTHDDMFHLQFAASLRESLFDRGDPLLADESPKTSLLLQGLPWAGSADKEREVMTCIYDRLCEGGMVLEPSQFTDAQSPFTKVFFNRTSENGATTGMLGSGRKTISLLYDLKQPMPCRETTYLNPHVLPPYLDFKLTALKEQKENRTVDVTTHFTVTPQSMPMNSSMWMETINSASRLTPRWRPTFFVTWIHAELDFMSGAIRMDIDQLLRQKLPPADYTYFRDNSIIVPSRPRLDHKDGHFAQCGGAGLGYWLFIDPQNPETSALRRRLLSLLFGDPKTMVAHGTLHGVRTIVFQPHEIQNQITVSDHPFPVGLNKLTHWMLAFDNLPFEMNTHMLFVLLVHGYGIPASSILNICHDYDVLNHNSISASERGTPRTVVMFSIPEPVLLALHYKTQLRSDIESLFPSSTTPSYMPSRDDTFRITISSLNLGHGNLPPLPASAQLGSRPPLRLSREQLLVLCEDNTSVPAQETPPISMHSKDTTAPSTPPRNYLAAAANAPSLSSDSPLATMASWRSPLQELSTTSSRASSPRKRRTEEIGPDTEHESSTSPVNSSLACTTTPSRSLLDTLPGVQPSAEQCFSVLKDKALSDPRFAHNLVGWALQIANLATKDHLLHSQAHAQVLREAIKALTGSAAPQPDFHQVDDGTMDQSEEDQSI